MTGVFGLGAAAVSSFQLFSFQKHLEDSDSSARTGFLKTLDD